MRVKTIRGAARCVSAALAAALASANASAAWDLNLPVGVTPISREVYDLHMLILWICVIIGVVVFGAMFIAIVLHRKSAGRQAAQFHHSTFAEILWTIVPVLILVGMAIPATKTLVSIDDSSAADMSIKVTGYQWKWRYEYLDEDITFYSNLAPSSRAAIYTDPAEAENYLLEVDNRVVLPVGKKVRVLLTAGDVIHAWWVPALGMKKDAIPGFVNELWVKIEEPGVYRGQCAELCGKDHGFMPIVVEAKEEADYRQWVADMRAEQEAQRTAAERRWTKPELMAEGESVYTQTCAACHRADGSGVPGTFPPIAGSGVATGDLDEHMDVVLNGRAGTAMQAFGATLSDAQLAAVVTYQRNAFGNDTGDVVQPASITAARKF